MGDWRNSQSCCPWCQEWHFELFPSPKQLKISSPPHQATDSTVPQTPKKQMYTVQCNSIMSPSQGFLGFITCKHIENHQKKKINALVCKNILKNHTQRFSACPACTLLTSSFNLTQLPNDCIHSVCRHNAELFLVALKIHRVEKEK